MVPDAPLIKFRGEHTGLIGDVTQDDLLDSVKIAKCIIGGNYPIPHRFSPCFRGDRWNAYTLI